MTSYYVELIFEMGRPFDDKSEEHFDEVAAALADIKDVDGDLGIDLAKGRVELCITVDVRDRQEALLAAFTAARTAIHTAGGATRGWDGWLNEMLETDRYRSSVVPSSLGCLT